MKKKHSNSEYAFLGMGIFLFIILLATVALAPHHKNKSFGFSFKIKDPQILVAKAGGVVPIELEKNLYFQLLKPNDASIVWEVDGGTIEGVGTQVKWNLPKRDGTYTVMVYKKSGELKLGKDELAIKIAVNPDLAVPRPVVIPEFKVKENSEDLDTDGDGLTDKEEIKKRLNRYKMDTDDDGLSDSYEVNHLKTNPLLKDTDRDGILDGYEDAFHENPLKKTSKKSFSAQIKDRTNKASVVIEGSPESIYHLFIEALENDLWANTYGMITPIYKVTTIGDFSSAELSIVYDQKKLSQLNLREEDLSICEIDLSVGEIKILSSEVDMVNNTVSAKVKDFCLFSVVSKHSLKTSLLFDLIFVIDDSGSMVEPQGISSVGSDENNFRLEIAEKICFTFLKAENRFGVVQFSSESKIIQSLTDDKNLIEEALLDINWHSQGKTNIGGGLLSAIHSFDQSKKQKLIILLSDGMDTSETNGVLIEQAIQEARKANITIYTIGLGSAVDVNELKKIANQTQGKYFFAENVREIDKFFLQIQSAIQIVNELDEILLDKTLWKFLKRINLEPYSITKAQKRISRENEKLYGVLIGESGFVMPDNSLPVNNGTLSRTGVCAGIAAICTELYNNTISKYLNMEEAPLITDDDNREEQAIKRGDSYFAPGYILENISPFNDNKPLHTFTYDILKKTYTSKKDSNGNILIHKGKVLLEFENELKELGFQIVDHYDPIRKCKIQSCNGLDINVPNQVNSKWNTNEKEFVNSIFRLYYEQPYYALHNGNQLYEKIRIHDIGILREMIQKKKAVILYMYGKTPFKTIGHAVVLKNIYSVVSLDKTKQDGNPLYCFYIYDNNYPDRLMPLLVKYNKIRDANGKFGYNPEFHVFGEYDNINFYEIGYYQRRR
jgi:Mg-chelatase subunit ChlD